MEIKKIDGLSIQEIRNEVDKGAKFVHFTYCISLLVVTFRRSSSVYFVKSGESSIKYGWPFLIISFILGWWGIPWGPVYTIGAIFSAFSGKKVTEEIMSQLEAEEARNNPITGWDNFNQ